MDKEANGLTDGFLARHTKDPALLNQLLDRIRESSTHNRPTGRSTEVFIPQNTEAASPLFPTPLPPCINDHIVESLGSTNNSSHAIEQGVARATASMHRVMEERAERKRFQKEMERREKEIRGQRARERREREAIEIDHDEASNWPQQQEAIPGPGCTSLNEKITRNTICGYCCRPKYVSRSSVMNTDFDQTDSCESTNSPLPVLKQSVEETCPSDERVLREREEREEFESEIEGNEREIREQRASKGRETSEQARGLEEASRWPRRQEAITGPWCDCRNEDSETTEGSQQGFEALSEPQQETG
ncbi:hypothetical protein ACROYT_G023467 [Oculina patagonica]